MAHFKNTRFHLKLILSGECTRTHLADIGDHTTFNEEVVYVGNAAVLFSIVQYSPVATSFPCKDLSTYPER